MCAELDAALFSLKMSSSPGPDGVTYSALVHLGPHARTKLLKFYNNTALRHRFTPPQLSCVKNNFSWIIVLSLDVSFRHYSAIG